MTEPTAAIAFARSQSNRFLAEPIEFISIPRISTLTEHQPDMRRAAEWVANQLRSVGMENVEILPTQGHPVIYGDWLRDVGQLTVLVYGHCDVQPTDPLEDWVSPPFEPTVRGDNLHGRGASDMKGQLHAFLKALESLLRSGELPVNVKVLVEGEEEIGSPSLKPFVRQQAARLKCDVVLNADSGILRPDMPSLVYGLRGGAYFEVWVYGSEHDLHSGIFAGSVHNPAQVLCELIAGMHDADGHITLPGFYDQVRSLSAEERSELASGFHSDEAWAKIAGVQELYGEKGFTTPERLGARPTLEVSGLLAGFTGEGMKTVLPARAMAKISTRLVPYQDDKAIESQLKAYMMQHAPTTVRWDVRRLSSNPAVLIDRNTAGARAASDALEATFGAQPVFLLIGGTVPVVSLLKAVLGVDSILMGFALLDDNQHAPNEKLHLPNYYLGIEAYILFFYNFSRS